MAITKTIKEYQITVVGKQKGVNIPINHRYVVTKAMIRKNEEDDGYDLWIEICTFKDSNHTTLLINDLFSSNNLTFDLGATLPTTKIATVVKTNLETWLDAEATIGSSNWTEIS